MCPFEAELAALLKVFVALERHKSREREREEEKTAQRPT